MRTLIAFISLVAAGLLAWQYNVVSDEKKAAEEVVVQKQLEAEIANREWSQQLARAVTELEAANAQIAKLSLPREAKPLPTPKPNWIEERNRDWKSPLANPPTGSQRAVYFHDSYQGRYWIDSAGIRHYF